MVVAAVVAIWRGWVDVGNGSREFVCRGIMFIL